MWQQRSYEQGIDSSLAVDPSVCVYVWGLSFGIGLRDTKGDLQNKTRTEVGHQIVPNFRPDIVSVFLAPAVVQINHGFTSVAGPRSKRPRHCPRSPFGGFPNSAHHSAHMCCANLSGDFKVDSRVRFFVDRSGTSKVTQWREPNSSWPKHILKLNLLRNK